MILQTVPIIVRDNERVELHESEFGLRKKGIIDKPIDAKAIQIKCFLLIDDMIING